MINLFSIQLHLWFFGLFTILSNLGIQQDEKLIRPTIRIPTGPVAPMIDPRGKITLRSETILVCDSDVECVVLVSPQEKLKVTAEKGPIRVRGTFFDGIGQIETRTYAGPWVYFFEVAQNGDCEILILPVGGKENDVVRRTVHCLKSPQPPPEPPTPEPPHPKPSDPFRVIFVVESSTTLTADQVAVVDGKKVRDWLTEKTTPENGIPGFRKYDPQVSIQNEQPEMKALWEAVRGKIQSTPALVIAVGRTVDILPLPRNPEEAISILEKYFSRR